jgi:DNA-binding PadR family transcriptional regulator
LLSLKVAVTDRRKRYVALTKKGKATLQRARRLWRTAEGRFEKIFGQRHAADLRAVLLNIAGNDELNSCADSHRPARRFTGAVRIGVKHVDR